VRLFIVDDLLQNAPQHLAEIKDLRTAHGRHAEEMDTMRGVHAHQGTMAERVERVEATVETIEGTVVRAYQQTDQIAATLHKELQAKETLVFELREAYDELRKHTMANRTKATEPVSSAVLMSKGKGLSDSFTTSSPFGRVSSGFSSTTTKSPSSSMDSRAFPVTSVAPDIADELFRRIDTNGDGVLDKREFQAFVQRSNSPGSRGGSLRTNSRPLSATAPGGVSSPTQRSNLDLGSVRRKIFNCA